MLAAVMLTASGASLAQTADSLRFKHYQVDLDRWASLDYLLTAASPIRRDGNVYHGYTMWRVIWQYEWEVKDGLCRFERVDTQLNAQITIPFPQGGSPRRRERFANYVHALYQHELGHYRFGQMAAQHVRSELRRLPADTDCQRLTEAANSEALRIIGHYTAMERKYDLLTNHGSSQGASIAYYEGAGD
ncbi:DUF922 domain-containing protein [Geopseudomonas aromaticivorans]